MVERDGGGWKARRIPEGAGRRGKPAIQKFFKRKKGALVGNEDYRRF